MSRERVRIAAENQRFGKRSSTRRRQLTYSEIYETPETDYSTLRDAVTESDACRAGQESRPDPEILVSLAFREKSQIASLLPSSVNRLVISVVDHGRISIGSLKGRTIIPDRFENYIRKSHSPRGNTKIPRTQFPTI